MDTPEVDMIAFLGVLEFALLFLVLAVIFVIRSNALSRRVRSLQQELVEAQQVAEPETISYEQYLRDEVLRNQELIEQSAAAGEEDADQGPDIFSLRKQFLELELEAHELEKNPQAFQERLATGMQELIEQLRPEAETVTETVVAEVESIEEVDLEEVEETEDVREIHDTHDEEVDHLKVVINNQQDALAALRAQLNEAEHEIDGMEDILHQLDDFEKQSAELHRCMQMLEKENEELKAAREKGNGSAQPELTQEPAQLTGLKNMVGKQQETITNLQDLIRELAPNATKAKELEDAVEQVNRANQELTGCVSVLEDENAMLRGELEQVLVQMEEQSQAAAERAASESPEEGAQELEEIEELSADDSFDELLVDSGETDDGQADETQQLEIKVQELEALIEFKDATIEELEKQYNALESKYLTATGAKQVN